MASTAHGLNGQISFDGAFITITRKGFLARWTVGARHKRVPVSSVVSVQLKQANVLNSGFVRFNLSGAGPATWGARVARVARVIAPVEDPDTVMFNKTQQSAFEALLSDVERGLAAP